MLTQDRLRAALDYDPENGFFWWKIKTGTRSVVGAIAGRTTKEGYVEISVDGRGYMAHRLAWFYVHGEWPPKDLDHINMDKANNSISNLRPATRSQNRCNTPARADNKSGYKGVSWNRRSRKWSAHIQLDGKGRWLGNFDDPEEAFLAYKAAAQELHGEFARHA